MSEGNNLEEHIKKLMSTFDKLNTTLLAENSNPIIALEFIQQLLASFPKSWQYLVAVIDQTPPSTNPEDIQISADVTLRLLAEFHCCKAPNSKKPTICSTIAIIIVEIANLKPQIGLLSVATVVALVEISNRIVANLVEEITNAATTTIIEEKATLIKATITTENKMATTKEDVPTIRIKEEVTMSNKATLMKIKASKQILQVLTAQKLHLSSQHPDLPTKLNNKHNPSLQKKTHIEDLPEAIKQEIIAKFNSTNLFGQTEMQYSFATNDTWIIDSGASCHVTNQQEHLNNFTPIKSTVMGIGGQAKITGLGTLTLNIGVVLPKMNNK